MIADLWLKRVATDGELLQLSSVICWSTALRYEARRQDIFHMTGSVTKVSKEQTKYLCLRMYHAREK